MDKQYFKDDHSIFYACEKSQEVNRDTLVLPRSLYEKNKSIFNDFLKFHHNEIESINNHLDEIDDGSRVYLFGAHIFSQYLISNGLNLSKIVCILDNDPNKHNKRLYGTSLYVESPAILKSVTKPIVILKAGSYNEEIKKDIISNINSSVSFLE